MSQTDPAARPVAENLLRGQGREARLLGGRHKISGAWVFPFPAGPDAQDYELAELAPQGTLWSFTVQRFRPKSPFNGDGDDAGFAPYGVGYVELAGQIIVETRILSRDFAALQIGEPMVITTEAYRHDGDGTPVLTYAFTPLREETTA